MTPRHEAEPELADTTPDPDDLAALFTVPDDSDVEPGAEDYPETPDGRQDDGEDD